jgi:hypothetical protein
MAWAYYAMGCICIQMNIVDIRNNSKVLPIGLKQKETYWSEENILELLRARKETEKINATLFPQVAAAISAKRQRRFFNEFSLSHAMSGSGQSNPHVCHFP